MLNLKRSLWGRACPNEIFLVYSNWVKLEDKQELWQLCRKTSRGPKSLTGRKANKQPDLLKLSIA